MARRIISGHLYKQILHHIFKLHVLSFFFMSCVVATIGLNWLCVHVLSIFCGASWEYMTTCWKYCYWYAPWFKFWVYYIIFPSAIDENYSPCNFQVIYPLFTNRTHLSLVCLGGSLVAWCSLHYAQQEFLFVYLYLWQRIHTGLVLSACDALNVTTVFNSNWPIAYFGKIYTQAHWWHVRYLWMFL